MKYLPFLILLASCGSVQQPKKDQPSIETPEARSDKIIKETTRYSDSVYAPLFLKIEYHGKYNQFMIRGKEYEIKYLRTEDEKYRRLGQRDYDSANKYGRLLKALETK